MKYQFPTTANQISQVSIMWFSTSNQMQYQFSNSFTILYQHSLFLLMLKYCHQPAFCSVSFLQYHRQKYLQFLMLTPNHQTRLKNKNMCQKICMLVPSSSPTSPSVWWDSHLLGHLMQNQGSYRQVWVKFKDFSRTSKDYPTISRTKSLWKILI